MAGQKMIHLFERHRSFFVEASDRRGPYLTGRSRDLNGDNKEKWPGRGDSK